MDKVPNPDMWTTTHGSHFTRPKVIPPRPVQRMVDARRVSSDILEETCGVVQTSGNGLTTHKNGSLTGWALPPPAISGDGQTRLLFTSTHSAYGGPFSINAHNRQFESKVDPEEAAERAKTRVSYANETNNIVRMNKIKARPLTHLSVVGGEQLKLKGVDPKIHTCVQRSWTYNPMIAILRRNEDTGADTRAGASESIPRPASSTLATAGVRVTST